MSQSTSNLSTIEVSQILPFLYVGCQEDALSTKTMHDNHITHVINVSATGEKTPFLNEYDDDHFLRIPINDCLHAQLLPYMDKAYTFIEKARLNNGRVLIHCLAGISRSPSLAIAYIMRYLHLSADDAYQYVKQRRSQISPNFNFLGQLSDYECNLLILPESTRNTNPIVKCDTIETPLNDRRHFVRLEGCSNNTDNSIKSRTNTLSRPTSFNLNNTLRPKTLSLSSTIGDSSVKSCKQQNLLSTLPLINSSCDDVTNNKRIETKSKNTNTSSYNEQTTLINTYFQESTILSKS